MRRCLPAALAVLALTGCSTPAQPAARPTPTETPAPAPAAVASPKQQKVGATQTYSAGGIDMKVTVMQLRQPFTTNVPGLLDRRGYEYAGVEVKACVTRNGSPQPVTVSWSPWSLSYRSGVVVDTPSSWSPDGWDEPLYPSLDRVVQVGRCVRGWIPFEVRRGDGRPDLVTYAPMAATPVEWTVPA